MREAGAAGFAATARADASHALAGGERSVSAGFECPVPAGLGRPHPDRAAQFKPFAALRGYHELVSERERVVEPRPVMSEEDARELTERLSSLKRGDVVRVRYYEADAVVMQTGAVGQLDLINRTLAVVRRRIPIDDIIAVESCGD